MASAKSPVPEGYQTITPMICYQDTRKAIDWYVKAFGAQQRSISPGPDGKIMHAEIQIGNSRLMLYDEMNGSRSARALGGTPVTLWAFVEDCDKVHGRAVAAGAKATMAVADQFWGDRGGTVTDPFGIDWWIASRKEDLTADQMQARAVEYFHHAASPA